MSTGGPRRRRVVVTGIGLVSPVGLGTDPTWASVLAGRPGVGTITLFDPSRHAVRFAGEVKGFDPLQWLDRKEVKKCGRFIQFAIAATSMAMAQSGLQVHDGNATRVGVTIGSGIGGFEVIEREHTTLLERGPDRVSPFFILSAIVNLAAGQVSVRLGAKGPSSAVATACTTGAHSIGDAFRLIQGGYADAMVCGGTEASITPLAVAGSPRCARCRRATTRPTVRAGRGTRNVTASSSAKAQASWCSRSAVTPSNAARQSSRSSRLRHELRCPSSDGAA